MDKLKLHTPDLAEANFRKLAAMFPNAVTETITGYTTDENGREKPIIERAIDADVLRQEISAVVVEGPQERYQFTWPDKKKSVVLANAPIAKTLRLDRSKSVGQDGTRGGIDTENIYIEGDNLDALKLLQETYLGKVKMIYIDPPYNTGNDSFVYDDDRSISGDEFAERSGQYDENGNLLFDMRPNNESNGRFHTDWLNMLYPRLRIAKDLLSEDGIIFISISDVEVENLKKMCCEIFGYENFMADAIWQHSVQSNGYAGKFVSQYNHTIIFSKSHRFILKNLPRSEEDNRLYKNPDNDPRGPWRAGYCVNGLYRPNLKYTITTPGGKTILPPEKGWRWSYDTLKAKMDIGEIIFNDDETNIIHKLYLSDLDGKVPENLWEGNNFGTSRQATAEIKELFSGMAVFDTPKPTKLVSKMLQMAVNSCDIILDFFSGSATTAHAIMQLNAEDGGNRKFIMVQLPEVCGETSEARKAGYSTICDIGEERIRRAGDKIRAETGADIDYGFRVFRVDSTNMEDVYYIPAETKQDQLDFLAENIKPDRTPEDLLFQVMLDLGILLSSSIEETVIAGKKVFSVADGYLLACFDKNVTEETVTEIAKRRPFYAVFRDSSMAADSVAANFEQIFETYSPKTVRKVL